MKKLLLSTPLSPIIHLSHALLYMVMSSSDMLTKNCFEHVVKLKYILSLLFLLPVLVVQSGVSRAPPTSLSCVCTRT